MLLAVLAPLYLGRLVEMSILRIMDKIRLLVDGRVSKGFLLISVEYSNKLTARGNSNCKGTCANKNCQGANCVKGCGDNDPGPIIT